VTPDEARRGAPGEVVTKSLPDAELLILPLDVTQGTDLASLTRSGQWQDERASRHGGPFVLLRLWRPRWL
jgi:hypothetical protein